MTRVDESFDRGSITLRVGERIEIALAENASTGYRWIARRASSSAPALREIDEHFAVPEGLPTAPGAPGLRRLRFEAAAAGSTELELEYRRGWDAATPAARRFLLHVDVLPASSSSPSD